MRFLQVLKASSRTFVLLFALFLALGVFAVPATAAPCCSSCDIEEPNASCWRWCIFWCRADTVEAPLSPETSADVEIAGCSTREPWLFETLSAFPEASEDGTSGQIVEPGVEPTES